MEERELVSLVEREVAGSIGQWQGDLAGTRAKELEYYNSEPFGNEVDGESQVVSSDVFDTVEGMLPSLLRIFTSSDDVVQFQATGPEDEEAAKQRTDLCNYVFYKQNNGFLILYEWFKDALIQKNGIVKYWWDHKISTTKESYADLSEGQYLKFKQDDDVEILSETAHDDETVKEQRDQQLQQVLAQVKQQAQGNRQVEAQLTQQITERINQIPIPKLYDVEIRVTKDESKVCIETVPPEEFGISAKHKSVTIQDTNFCYHKKRITISELREMGCPEEVIAEVGGGDDRQDLSQESVVRDRFMDQTFTPFTETDPTMRHIWVTDCFMRVDWDDDGIAELRHIIKAGAAIWINEETDHINFATLTPIIMPHRWIGKSAAELVMNDQFTKSVIWRQMLNNLYLTNNPRKAVLSSPSGVVQANLDDLMNSRAGGIMREYVSNAIRNEETPFVAGAAFPMLEYIDAQKEVRTGQTRYSQGTDADSLNKMLDVHTEVPLSDGSFKLLRDIVDGDNLIGSDGNAVTVMKAHEIHDPERAYRIVFASGDEIFAGGEHLWTVMTERDHTARVSRTLTTDAVYKRKQEIDQNLYVPRVQRPRFGGGELPVDPYLLGCWLGDGTSAKSSITTMDEEIVESFRANGWNMYAEKTQNSGQATTWTIGSLGASLAQDGTTGRMVATGNAWLTKMTQIGVARNKHIPQSYLAASYDDRLELLRGLMDTDGCHHSGALCVFSQKHGRLLADTSKLIEGLGGWPKLSEVDPGNCGKEGQTYWNMTFHVFDNPFRLKRKADKWRAPQRNAISQPIVSVDPVPIRPMRCLTVDAADGLFCVGRRMTVTHNTARGIQMIQQAGQQRGDLIARIFAETGVKELMKGIAYMLSKYSTKEMTVRLRNKWVEVDPREWKNSFDMTINVGLGTGNKDVQIAHLNAMHQQQLELMQTGKGYMVSEENIFNLYTKMAEAMGFKHPEMFVSDPRSIDPRAKQPPPNPEMLKLQQADAEVQKKIQSNEKIRQFDAQTNKELEGIKAQSQIAIANIHAETQKQINAMKMQHEAQIAVFQGNGNATDQAKLQHDAQLEVMRQNFEKWKAELQASVQLQIAEMSAKTQVATANMTANTEQKKLETSVAQKDGANTQKLAKTVMDTLTAVNTAVAAQAETIKGLEQTVKVPKGHRVVRDRNGQISGLEAIQ